jgi:fumarylacetoacetase
MLLSVVLPARRTEPQYVHIAACSIHSVLLIAQHCHACTTVSPLSHNQATSALSATATAAPVTVTRTSLRNMHWTMAQQLAHHTVTGCNVLPGDLMGSGTISGGAAGEGGCMLELTRNGSEPLDFAELRRKQQQQQQQQQQQLQGDDSSTSSTSSAKPQQQQQQTGSSSDGSSGNSASEQKQELRSWLLDGDVVSLTGYCQGDSYRVGFGSCTGKVAPAL